MDTAKPTKENIRALLLQQMQLHEVNKAADASIVHTAPETVLDDLQLTWLEDSQNVQQTMHSAFSRRQLFGPLLRVAHSPETNCTESVQANKKKFAVIGSLAVVCFGLGAYSFFLGDKGAESTQQVHIPDNTTLSTQAASVLQYETTSSVVMQSDIHLQSSSPITTREEESTGTTVIEVATITVPVTTVQETIPATAPAETVPQTAPAATEFVAVETVPVTTNDVYVNVVCDAASTIIIRGMTPSELAGMCGISVETLQSYNTFNVLTQFITGSTVYLRPREGLTAQTYYKTCPEWFGTRRVVEPNFTLYNYLVTLGVTNPDFLITQTTLLKDYNLQNIVAGTKPCLPSLEALRVRYAVR